MKFIAWMLIAALGLAPLTASAAAINYKNTAISGQEADGQDLKGSRIENASVSDSNFAGSNMEGAYFRNVSFKNVSFAGANLRNSTCINTNLSGVDIRGADFTGASFKNCVVNTAISDSSTNFANVSLENTSLPSAGVDAAALSTQTIDATTTVVNTTAVQGEGPMNIAVDAPGTGGVSVKMPGMNIVVGNPSAGSSKGVRVDMPGTNVVIDDPNAGTKSTRVTTPGVDVAVNEPVVRELKSARAIADELRKPNAKVDLTVNFAFDSDQILDAGHKQVYEIAQALKSDELSGKQIRIEGHTDSKGTDEYNMDLSYRRAVSVLDELTKKYEVNTKPLSVKGFGESQPVAENDSDYGRAMNRRVTLVNVSRAALD